eukprot:1172743-Prorocentrum_minimum.AAC.1
MHTPRARSTIDRFGGVTTNIIMPNMRGTHTLVRRASYAAKGARFTHTHTHTHTHNYAPASASWRRDAWLSRFTQGLGGAIC